MNEYLWLNRVELMSAELKLKLNCLDINRSESHIGYGYFEYLDLCLPSLFLPTHQSADDR